MIGNLPKSVTINNKEFAIRSDYRVALLVFQAYNDPDYSYDEQTEIALECIIEDWKNLTEKEIPEAIEMVMWFLNHGEDTEESSKKKISPPKTLDWEQDEQMVFSAVNKVAGHEIRNDEYMHWWTFLGYFKDRGDCLLNTVMSLREKLANKKKLTKDEQEFYRLNKSMIDLKVKMSEQERAEIEKLRRKARSGKE